MKIYFCDICNESIPLTDLKDGRASTIKGKIFCGNCNPLNTVPESKKGNGAPLLVTLALFVLASAAAGYAIWSGDQLSRDVADLPKVMKGDLAEIRTQMDKVLASVGSLEGNDSGMELTTESLRKDQGQLQQSLADQGTRLDELQGSLTEINKVFDQLRSDRDLIHQLELKDGKIENSIAKLRESVANLDGKLSSMLALSGPVNNVMADPEDGSSPAAEQLDDATKKLVADLKHADASVRWSAVDSLSSTRNVSVVGFLLPLLKDTDAFVQFRVISTLREWNARSAVGSLIDLLRDGDAIVREEALEALVALTGNPARFDVTNGSPVDREKGVKVWEDWFSTNKARFEG